MTGYRTYVCIALAAAAYALHIAGFIEKEQLDTVLTGLGIPAAWFIRSAIK